MLETLELIEAGASRSEQHGIAGFGARVGFGNGGFDGTRTKQRNRAAQLNGEVPVLRCGNLEAAVAEAQARAKSGDTVLLAPACASFDQFENFEQRGREFKSLVQQLEAK